MIVKQFSNRSVLATTAILGQAPVVAAVALCGALLGGCNLTGSRLPNADDWRLILLNDVVIPAGRARALYQNGKQVARVDLYNPHCEIEIDTVDERPQRLHADSFYVTRRMLRVVSDEQSAMPASILSPLNCSEDNYYESLFWLASERQQDIRMLLCRNWSMSCDLGRHLTLAEILNVLGPKFKLE